MTKAMRTDPAHEMRMNEIVRAHLEEQMSPGSSLAAELVKQLKVSSKKTARRLRQQPRATVHKFPSGEQA